MLFVHELSLLCRVVCSLQIEGVHQRIDRARDSYLREKQRCGDFANPFSAPPSNRAPPSLTSLSAAALPPPSPSSLLPFQSAASMLQESLAGGKLPEFRSRVWFRATPQLPC